MISTKVQEYHEQERREGSLVPTATHLNMDQMCNSILSDSSGDIEVVTIKIFLLGLIDAENNL